MASDELAPASPATVPLLTGLDVDDAREVWASALCAQVDPELFFPEKGGSAAGAKAVCAACAVTELCLATFGPLVAEGVVGGLTAVERRARRRGLRRADGPGEAAA